MWTKLSHTIIKKRTYLVSFLIILTIFMGYHARNSEMSFNFAKTVPSSDPDMVQFEKFKSIFGEDGNIVAIGILDSSVYEAKKFKKLSQLTSKLKKVEGISNVLALPLVKLLKKDPVNKVFKSVPIFKDSIPNDQQELDSLFQVVANQRFYSNQIINFDNGATMILITIEKEVLNSKKRLQLTKSIQQIGLNFEKDSNIQLHYAGLPFVRSVVADNVKNEMELFLLLSVVVTGFILFLFFRTWDAVLFPMIVIVVVVIWVLGLLVLFGYKITILTGLIPPIIVVIGIPNAVYLLNKYHQEYEKHNNKGMAISRVVRKIGYVTVITNFTTAVGFLVLSITDITILKEFGIMAGINIIVTLVVSLILLPAVFSWLPPPNTKQIKHLKFKSIEYVIKKMNGLVSHHRLKVYFFSLSCILISIVGILRIESVSFMVDDLPKKSKIKKDLMFFEEHFGGIMPLEMLVDTKKKRGVFNIKTINNIEKINKVLENEKYVSSPVSLVNYVKASRQAFYNNNPDRYDIPSKREWRYISRYLKNNQDDNGLYKSFVDDDMSKIRISMQVADIGSIRMDSLLVHELQPKIDSITRHMDFDVLITGTTPLFIKGNKFLIKNLWNSLFLAFSIVALTMGVLFKNVKIIIISLIPNVIPLLITAGIMGFAEIPLKPSTALIFSIVFGISVDDSIHFLAKYKQELVNANFMVLPAIKKSLSETGSSMIYTSIILFFGFIIFVWSEFGGTTSLGLLTSITLIIAMVTNLILLPSLLITFFAGDEKKEFV